MRRFILHFTGERIPRATFVFQRQLSRKLILLQHLKSFGLAEQGNLSQTKNWNSPEHNRGHCDEAESSLNSELNNDEQESLPWYLRKEVVSRQDRTGEINLPEIPEGAPSSLREFTKILLEKYGMSEILVFDLKALDAEHEHYADKQAADYVLICTGKSQKHIFKAAGDLRLHIKHHYENIPCMEGMATGTRSPVARRRLLRRAGKGPLATDNEYGCPPNSWVMCNTGVDNIYIHMLTADRRAELSLETLWCKDEEIEKYKRTRDDYTQSDDILIGIRRFHTSTAFSKMLQHKRHHTGSAISPLGEHLARFKTEACDISDELVQNYILKMEQDFDKTSVEDHKKMFEFYKIIHVLNPQIIDFDTVKFSILLKYSNPYISLSKSINNSKLKQEDLVAYIKLLLDSPEIPTKYNLEDKNDARQYCDELCDRLSKFISTLYIYSKDTLDLGSEEELIPLLWRLTFYAQNNVFVGPKAVDSVVLECSPIPELTSPPLVVQANNRARDMLDLIDSYKNSFDLDAYELSPSFNELLMFTYGNTGNWSEFWKLWASTSFLSVSSDSVPSSNALTKWVRLAVFLSILNNRSTNLHFFQNYWFSAPGISNSFLDDFKATDGHFLIEESKAFKRAIERMLNSIQKSEVPVSNQLESVKELVNNL